MRELALLLNEMQQSGVYLATVALSVGRAKDFARILALLESGSVSPESIKMVADRHGSGGAWLQFEKRFRHASLRFSWSKLSQAEL